MLDHSMCFNMNNSILKSDFNMLGRGSYLNLYSKCNTEQNLPLCKMAD